MLTFKKHKFFKLNSVLNFAACHGCKHQARNSEGYQHALKILAHNRLTGI
jgi:hypothetical protein